MLNNMASPSIIDPKQASNVQELRIRLDKCWALDIDYPEFLKDVSVASLNKVHS